MFVAKSYENLTKLSEPFERNGKLYITVQLKSGLPKDVRAYTAKEYMKMYPGSMVKDSKAKPWDKYYQSQKAVLGFGNQNFIWTFKGVKKTHHEWFVNSPCRLSAHWGWYLPSEQEVPKALPQGVTAEKLYADGLFDEEEWLKEEIQNENCAYNYDFLVVD